ncbi:hypothetical protein PF005_g28901 [Phytophthora fragariae]|uniref:RxLR effector protein n=1 Tax=Phytophthora fragariae TaxID=53985 RepID=A0A6A3VGU6_9STRA|nr:hypothetical protein PF003_g11986 [Phytophthora fragariae]KAE8919789.1 hypothetical protein PF009_g29910 [Phytophthora fragariae]KAE8965668.1 hypothetical protein PF011_g28205 [Phytophthora fragariae]KAE9063442.1 hypothetical protein PF010_g28989 [Phytophthora fragariae]KAE9064218.1 hypothetical protein PF007_g29272 [Phytophthora fragariae]
MRLSYFLLAAALTLVSTSDPVSAATGISGVAATDSVQSDKRFLRSIESNQEKGDLDSADEDRVLNGVISKLKINIPEVNLKQFMKVPEVKNLKEPFTEAEVAVAIGQTKAGKACGPDRLGNEWYRDFATQLTPILTHLYNRWYQEGVFPATFLEADIFCLKKGGTSATH